MDEIPETHLWHAMDKDECRNQAILFTVSPLAIVRLYPIESALPWTKEHNSYANILQKEEHHFQWPSQMEERGGGGRFPSEKCSGTNRRRPKRNAHTLARLKLYYTNEVKVMDMIAPFCTKAGILKENHKGGASPPIEPSLERTKAKYHAP